MIGRMKQLERVILDKDREINQLLLENAKLKEDLRNIMDEDLKFKVCVEQELEIEELRSKLEGMKNENPTT